MKRLILLFYFTIMLGFIAFAQISDTVIYGKVQTNFPGGQKAYNKYISENAHYPQVALDNNIQGCVYIKFLIERDGSINNVTVYSAVGSGMDEEAMSLIKRSGKWIPEKVNGVAVRTRCIVPVNYILSEDGNNKLKGTVAGNAVNAPRLNSMLEFESYGISLSEINDYVGRSVKFTGKIYGTKAVSDTVFILTCGELTYSTRYVNVILMGKDVTTFDRKTKLLGYLIKGIGTIVKYNGTLIIVIDDRKKYSLQQGLSQKP